MANGGRGAVTSVFPRGGESDYSLVIVDGVQANAFGGGYDFAHLPVANIERIEVVRGPQSALYGSNAIGSVIRIVTRQGGAPSASASLEGGGFDTFRATAATSGAVGSWHWGASTERLTTDNFNGTRTASGAIVENDDYERISGEAAGGWRNTAGAAVRGSVRYSTDERGSPGPFGADPGGTYGGIDTVARGVNDRWLMSAAGAVPVGRARISAEATHSRLDSEFASQFGDSESYSRRTTARVQADATLARGFETSAGLELLGERAGGTFITATGNVLVPVKRGIAGFFGEARWNQAGRLFLAAGIRVDRITREALPGGRRRVLAAPAVRQRHGGVGEPQSLGGVVHRRNRRQLHEAARLGRHGHPSAGRIRARVHRQPLARAGAQQELRRRRRASAARRARPRRGGRFRQQLR